MKPTYNLEEIEKYYEIEEDGAVFSKRKGKYIKPQQNSFGYMFYYISTDGFRKWIFTHTLVALKYIGKRPVGCDIRHKDNNKGNNHYKNLEYISHSENILRSYSETNRQSYWKGKNKPSPRIETIMKMSDAKKRPLRANGVRYESITDFCRKNGINMRTYHRQYNKNGKVKGMEIRYV